jgi:hypothetical protein
MTILRLLQKIFRRDEFPDADRKVLEKESMVRKEIE